MFLTCVKKEMLTNILSFRYGMMLVLFVVLTVTATVVRTQIYKKQVVDHSLAVREHYRSMEMVKRFWQSNGLGNTVEKGPNPLAIFVGGLENEMTRSFGVSDWHAPTTGPRKLLNPSFQYGLQLDMALIINIVCSLLALMLVFDAVCGEREAGTLKVLLSGPIPRDVIITGKLAAGLLTLVIPVLLSWILSVVYVVAIAGVGLTPDQFARLGWIIGLSLVYVSFFFAVGIAVSCWTQRTATSLVACLFCWIIFVLAIPNLVPLAVKHFSPIPPESKILTEKAAISAAIHKELEPKWREELGAVNTDIEAMNNELFRRMDQEFNRREAAVDRYYNSLINKQLRLNQWVSRVSPSAAYTYAVTHLAGAGLEDYLKVLSAVDEFKRSFSMAMRDQNALRQKAELARQRKIQSGQAVPDEEIIDRYDPAQWPKFAPQVISLSTAMNQCWIDIVVVFGGTVMLFLAAFIGFVRYDVR